VVVCGAIEANSNPVCHTAHSIAAHTTHRAVNRRMDDWVRAADFDLATVEPEIVEVRSGGSLGGCGTKKERGAWLCI